jgi:hypothetical protein
VADRVNNRIQIFDQDDQFLDEWKQFGRPSGVYINKNDTIYVADSRRTPRPIRASGRASDRNRQGQKVCYIPNKGAGRAGVGADDAGMSIPATPTRRIHCEEGRRFVKK